MMQTNLVTDNNGYVVFTVDVDPDVEYWIDFVVYAATSWDSVTKQVLTSEQYLRGQIKWDGCSHVWFGDQDNDGYLHLCGKLDWDRHNQIMEQLYQLAAKTITRYDRRIAE